jgi:hypothetical protein
MLQFLSEIKKALAAAAAAGVAAYVTQSTKGAMTQADWALVVGSALVAGVLVFFVPNAPPALH